MDYTWKDEGEARRLFADADSIGRIEPFVHPAIRAADEVEPVGDEVFKWTRHFTAVRPAATPALRLTMDFVAAYEPTYWMIPAVSYNGNPWGSGREPKGSARDGLPWSFAAHRIAVPGATYSEGRDWSVALFAQADSREPGCACSLIPQADETIHRLIWPEEERPAVYSARDEYAPPFQAPLALQAGETFTATAYLVVAPVSEPRTAYRKFLNVAWRLGGSLALPARMRYTPQELWTLGVRFAKRELWAEEGVFRGFSVGLQWDGQRWRQRSYYKYEIGWAGQNASLAVSLLYDYLTNKDETSLAMGIATLDCWAAHARLASGLLRCVFDPILGDSNCPLEHDACNLGSAADAFFEAYELAARCGLDKPAYRDAALGICDFAVRAQHAGGKLGKSWNDDGVCLDAEGTIGCYLIPPLVLAYRVTHDRTYLTAAETAYQHYAGGLINDGYATAGALDTHCIDRESAAPLLGAGLALHEITGDDQYVRWAEHVAYYLATWQWHHTISYPEGSALRVMDCDTFGGTAVSTQHHHLDPWAVRYVRELMRLAELTENDIWRRRALAGWANGMIGVSDGSLVLNGVTLPPGSQPEGYFHTRWIDRGGVAMWLVAWPTAFRLETLRRMRDWSILEP